jgi:hypothetical protein
VADHSAIWRAVFAQIRGLRNWDWRAISACTVLALFIWIFNALNKSYTTVVAFPVRFEVREDHVVALVPPPKSVAVNVTGTGWNLLRKVFHLDVEEAVLEVKNPLRVRFMLTRSLRPVLEKAMSDLTINNFVDDSVQFHYEPILEKNVQLGFNPREVALEDGYRITSPVRVEPVTATITGPPTLLAAVGDTLWLELGDKVVSEDFRDQLPIRLPDLSPVGLLGLSLDRATVAFEVRHFTPQQAMVPLELVGFPADSSVQVQPAVVMVKYFLQADEPAPAEDIRVQVDYRDLRRPDTAIRPSQVLPASLRFVEIHPPIFKVVYENNRADRRHRGR